MIIYDGEELVVHHHPGASKYNLVTFIGIGVEPDAARVFLLQDFVARENINCFGVTTRKRGFYVTPEMDHVVAAIAAAIGDDPRRTVVFGQSMGGYAAIKYSRRLSAQAAIALSPQYSMDLDELEFPGEEHAAIFRAAFSRYAILQRASYKGMGVREEDCCPDVFVIHDPSMEDDAYFTDLFRRKVPRARTVPFYRGGHALLEHLGSYHALFTILHAAASDGDRGQKVVDAVFDLQLNHESLNIHKDNTSNNALVYNLLQRGRIKDALGYFVLCARKNLNISSGFPAIVDLGAEAYQRHLLALPLLMISRHGYFLAYSISRQRLVLSASAFSGDDVSPVFISNASGAARFFIMLRAREFDIDPEPGGAPACLASDGGHALMIMGAAGALGSDGAGNLASGAGGAADPELFVAVPLCPENPLLQGGAPNWFNDTVVNTRTLAQRDKKARLLTRLLRATRRRETGTGS